MESSSLTLHKTNQNLSLSLTHSSEKHKLCSLSLTRARINLEKLAPPTLAQILSLGKKSGTPFTLLLSQYKGFQNCYTVIITDS